MIPLSRINSIKSYVDRQFVSLSIRIDRYLDLVDGLKRNRDTFRDCIARMTFEQPRISQLIDLDRLADSYRYVDVDRENLIREIDCIAAIIAGNIAYVLDECIENYSILIKSWCRKEIDYLANICRNDTSSKIDVIYFPTAVGILAPYIFKTKNATESEKFASVRNAIRNLIRY